MSINSTSINELPIFNPEILQLKLSEYAEKYPNAIAILDIGGVHPTNRRTIVNPYMPADDNQKNDNEDFTNVGKHCIAVGYVAEQVAKALLSQGLIDQSILDYIIQRALMHDANKRFEVMRSKTDKKYPGTIDVYSPQAYEAISTILQNQGLNNEIANYLASAGKETGHNSMSMFVQIDNEGNVILNPDRTIADMIIHIADDMTFSPMDNPDTTSFVTTSERMTLAEFPRRYPKLYTQGFGFDSNRNPKFVQDINNTDETQGLSTIRAYATWQRDVAKIISSHLQKLIDPENQQDPEIFLAELINKDLT